MTPGILESIMHNFLATRAANELKALHHIVGLAILNTRVEVFLVLTNDDYIHLRVLGLHKGIIGHAGTDVGVQAKGGADHNIKALVASTLGCGDGSFEKDFGTTNRFPGPAFDTSSSGFE